MEGSHHPDFLRYLDVVLTGIQDWQQRASYQVGRNLASLSTDQQNIYRALKQIELNAHEEGHISQEQAEQHWEDLQELYKQVQDDQLQRDAELAQTLQQEERA